MKCSRCKAHCTVRVRKPDMWYDICHFYKTNFEADKVIGCNVNPKTIDKWVDTWMNERLEEQNE